MFDPATLHASFVGADAVVNLLTRVPPAPPVGEPEAGGRRTTASGARPRP